jgi:phosphatidylinositol kinase/protein kinase (PI-3  family)
MGRDRGISNIVCFGCCSSLLDLTRVYFLFRIAHVEKSIDIWHKLLRIRTLVVDPKDEPTIHIKFASLCRKNGRPNLALRTLVELSGADLGSFDKKNIPLANPLVSYAIMKHTLQMGDFDTARHQLRAILNSFHSSYRNHPENPELSRLLAKAHINSGDLYKVAILKFGKEVGPSCR